MAEIVIKLDENNLFYEDDNCKDWTTYSFQEPDAVVLLLYKLADVKWFDDVNRFFHYLHIGIGTHYYAY